MKFNKLILILSASFNLIVQTSYASSAMSQSMRYPVPNGFMHLFLNDLVYYVTSSDNIINLANLSSRITGNVTGADLLKSAKECGEARYEENTTLSATVVDIYGTKTYNTVSAESLTFNNKLISAKDLAQSLLNKECASSTVENKPCGATESQCKAAGATYENSNCSIKNSTQCSTIGGIWDSSSNICNCKSQSSATGESFQKNKFINNNFNNNIWSRNVCLVLNSKESCKNSPSDLNGTDYGKLSWDDKKSICKGPETACQLSLLGYLPLDTLVRNLPTQVAKIKNTKKAYQQFMQSLAQNPLVIRFIYSLISDINWISQWSNSLLKSSIGESFSSQGGSTETHESALKNAKTILPYLIKPSALNSKKIEAQYKTIDIPLFSTPTSNENYNSIINPYYLNNNPDSVLPQNFKFTNLKYPVSYVTITDDGNSLPVPINEESFNYCKYKNQLNQSNCIMLSQTGIPFGISQPNSGLKSLLLANISESNPKNPLWTDAYCMYQQSNNPAIYDTDRCQTNLQQFQSYWGLVSGLLFAFPTLKSMADSLRENYTKKGRDARTKRQLNDQLASAAEDVKRKRAEVEYDSKMKKRAQAKVRDLTLRLDPNSFGADLDQAGRNKLQAKLDTYKSQLDKDSEFSKNKKQAKTDLAAFDAKLKKVEGDLADFDAKANKLELDSKRGRVSQVIDYFDSKFSSKKKAPKVKF